MNEIIENAKKVWDTFSKIDVSDHVELKGGLKYLPWAWLWAMVMMLFPDSTYTVRKSKAIINGCENFINYFTDGRFAWVEVEVTISGITHEMYLPIMNFKNQPISVDRLTSFMVNTAIQRCLAKCVSVCFGLGYEIYAGDDLVDVYVADSGESTKEVTTTKPIAEKPVVTKVKKDEPLPMTIAQALSFEVTAKDGTTTTLKATLANCDTEEKAQQMMGYLSTHSTDSNQLGSACSVLIQALSKGTVKFG